MKPIHTLWLVLIVFAVLFKVEQNATSRPTTHTYMTDSGGKKADSIKSRGRETTPALWARRTLDSMLRPINLFVVEMDTTGESPWRHVDWNYIDSLYKDKVWRARDTSFVLLGDSCIKIKGYLGRNASVPDTIRITNQCQGTMPSLPCYAYRSIPLGCEETTYVDVEVDDTIQVCDTLCYYTQSTVRDSTWFILSPAEFRELYLFNGGKCDTASNGTLCLVKQPDSSWLGNYDEITNPNYKGRACPTGSLCSDSVCCFKVSTFYSWLYSKQIYDFSVYLQYTQVTDQIKKYVPCLTNPSALKEVVNCRDSVITTIRQEVEVKFVPAGRDTLILMDTCNTCLIPKITCEPGTYETDTLQKPIYISVPIYGVTYDTVPCQRPYTIITGFDYQYIPATQTDTCLPRVLITNCSPSYSPGKRPVPYLSSDLEFIYDACFSCTPFDIRTFKPVPGVQYCWMDTTVYNSFLADFDGCKPDVCIRQPILGTIYGNCCPKDTTIWSYCVDKYGNPVDPKPHTFQIPNIDSVCTEDSIITNYEIIGWKDSLTGYYDEYITRYIPGDYKVGFVDTCICLPTLNGKPFCGDFWILKCGVPIPWEGNTLNIPCDDPSPADGLTQEQIDAFITVGQLFWESRAISDTAQIRLIDTANALRATIDSLEGVVANLQSSMPSCGRTYTTGDGTVSVAWPYEPMAVQLSYIDGDPTVPLRWSWDGSANIIIKGDPTWQISYCIIGTNTP